MQITAKFEKVSFEEFKKSFDLPEEEVKKIYDDVKIPTRATCGSAGYDFSTPFDFELNANETVKIPTGIRAKIKEGWLLAIFPRSGLGFKFRLQLDNTVGIIDADYYNSDNEGHIFIKVTNCSNENKTVCVKAGGGFAQGIFLPFGITEDDAATETRNGGFGSTDKR